MLGEGEGEGEGECPEAVVARNVDNVLFNDSYSEGKECILILIIFYWSIGFIYVGCYLKF